MRELLAEGVHHGQRRADRRRRQHVKRSGRAVAQVVAGEDGVHR